MLCLAFWLFSLSFIFESLDSGERVWLSSFCCERLRPTRPKPPLLQPRSPPTLHVSLFPSQRDSDILQLCLICSPISRRDARKSLNSIRAIYCVRLSAHKQNTGSCSRTPPSRDGGSSKRGLYCGGCKRKHVQCDRHGVDCGKTTSPHARHFHPPLCYPLC